MEHRVADSLAAYMDEGMVGSVLPTGTATAGSTSLLCTDLDQLLELFDGDTNATLNIGDPGIDGSETRNQGPANCTATSETNILQNPFDGCPQSVQVTATAPSQPKQQTKKKKNYDPNRARTERRFEMRCLRKQIKDLELTLKQLQTIQRQKGGAGHDQLALRKKPRVGNIRPGVWEAICARQLQRRLQVERENVYLKKVYSSQVQVARHLQRLMHKSIVLEDTSNAGTKRVDVADTYTEEVEARIFQELRVAVDTAYLEVVTLFEANCAAYPELPTRKPLLYNAVNEFCMGLFDSRVVPFDMRATGDAWWRRWHKYKGQSAAIDGGNVICEKYGLELEDSTTNTTATFYDQQVLKRYMEEDRIVIIWYAYIEPLEINKQRVTGIHFLEKWSALIEPYYCEVETDSSGSRETSTRVSTACIIEPTITDPQLWDEARMAAFTKFLLATSSDYMSTINETIENLLVDQALQSDCE
ncbi:hypothetical protein PHYBOEH_006628 [Phytophthora boehmeriae]|uniref:M96 mating-specific protein family n=1 Tax=Phytophthora boehmeriae TaxID=109152 RepID=A0A8T1WEM4_9STRA|nr:hypothetical protein PHYBOEH_006628 [Phytophthora boehmeriae]